MLTVRHYYHVFASGAWAEPVREHFQALGAAGFRGDIIIGLVGPTDDRKIAREMIGMHLRTWGLPEHVEYLEAREGHEQLTLRQIYTDVHQNPGEFAVLYAHDKGSWDNSAWNACWRRSMTRHVISGWENCEMLLEKGYDAVGCHWLTPGRYHKPPGRMVTSPFFGGNFWMARASYLRKLPLLEEEDYYYEDRYQAEAWIGLEKPRVRDLLPGWPTLKLCATGLDERKQVRAAMRR